MKKTLSVLLCVCMILSLFTVISYAKVYERPEYDTSKVLVTIKKEYSGQGGIYYPCEFSGELVESVERLMYIDEEHRDNPLFNKDNFHDIIALCLKEPSQENVELLLEILADNPLVESAGKNYIIYLDPLYIMGDADNDGRITSGDARILLRISVGLEKREARHVCQFDTDNDGKTTAADARKVLRVSVGLDEPHYYEFSGG